MNDKNLNKQKLLKYLRSHDLIVIATQGERPSAATVYYGIDDEFNIYIVTSPDTEHGKNILANGKVAGVVVNTNQPMFNTEYKIGVQFYGISRQLTKSNEIKNALTIWAKERKETIDMFMKNIDSNTWESRPFIIKPSEI